MSGFEPKLANAFYNGRNNKGKSSTQKKKIEKRLGHNETTDHDKKKSEFTRGPLTP